MWNRERWLLGIAAVSALAGAVWACGPDFPNQLLSDRAATLMATPVNTFAYEAAHLRVASDELKAHEAPVETAEGDAPVSTLDAGLPAEQLALLQKMAQQGTGDDAYAAGAGLPEAIRLYAAAAVDIHHAGADPQRLVQAMQRLHALLALPPEQARPRAVAATYMLGEIGLKQFIACVNCKPDDPETTVRGQFAQTRVLALQGAPDPQGLAVASYGEEARLYLRGDSTVGDGSAEGNFCRWQGFIAGSACPATIPAPLYARAMGLYAEQAARGSDSGVQSLRHLAGYAFGHPNLLAGLLDDPLAQRVLVAYALAYSADRSGEEPASDNPSVLGRNRLVALVAAIEQRGLAHVEGADRLAALAYRSGRYDLAAALSRKQSGPLSSWVQAKLALRAGDMAAADAAYAQAIKAFPPTGEVPGLERDGVDLLHGEQGVLSLARGEYVQALEQLWARADVWWGDIAYLAERVLTTDELRHFVDTRVPASSATMAAPEQEQASYAYTDGQVGRATALRELLARRLMREGRYQDALGYFREPAAAGAAANTQADSGAPEEPPRPRAWAQQYADAMGRSQSAWTDIGKAEALFQAATVAREHGMEILGYEADPDYYALDGMYQGGLGQDTAKVGPYLTQGEHDRFAATAAQPPRRFHYRYVAADEASRAADLLPPRSQAFAAVLCKATGWMLQGPPDYTDQFAGYGEPKPTALPERIRRAGTLYQRYVQQGAHVSWAGDFGRSCQAPDFDRARALLRQQRITHARHLASHYRWYVAGIGALVLIGLGALLRRRRRRRHAG